MKNRIVVSFHKGKIISISADRPWEIDVFSYRNKDKAAVQINPTTLSDSVKERISHDTSVL